MIFLCFAINTSSTTSKFDYSSVKLGSILTTIAEKLSSCFYEILSKTFYMTSMYLIHQGNGLIAQFLSSSTYIRIMIIFITNFLIKIKLLTCFTKCVAKFAMLKLVNHKVDFQRPITIRFNQYISFFENMVLDGVYFINYHKPNSL